MLLCGNLGKSTQVATYKFLDLETPSLLKIC